MFEYIKSLILEGIRDEPNSFIGCKISKDSCKKIRKFVEKNNIPSPLSDEDLHITLIYSRKVIPEFEPISTIDPPIIAEVVKIDFFGETKDALVLVLKSPELSDRHNEIREEYGATHDFDSYKPHLSLSYEAKGVDLSTFDINELGPLEIVKEYAEHKLTPDAENEKENKL